MSTRWIKRPYIHPSILHVGSIVWILCLFLTPVFGQLVIPDSFLVRLDNLQADIIRPLDSDFRSIQVPANRFLPTHFAMYSKQEKLEIRYYLQAESEMGPFVGMPHVAAGRLLIDVSSNDEDAVTTAHSFQGETLATYRADWAKLFTFQPKRRFSDTNFAQMVALYQEGIGMLYVFLLFDKAPDTLDSRRLGL